MHRLIIWLALVLGPALWAAAGEPTPEATPALDATSSTIIFQIINFLVLMAVLYWLLYQRVLKVLKQRREKIETELNTADEAVAAAAEKERELGERLAGAEGEADRIRREAREQAEAERVRLLEQGRDQAAAESERLGRALAGEKQRFLEEFKEELAAKVAALGRKILGEAARPDWQAAFVAMLDEQLAGLEGEEKKRLAEQLAGKRAVLRSAVELAAGDREKIAGRLKELAGREVELKEEVDPELVAGVRLELPTAVISADVARQLEEAAARFQDF